MEAAKDPPPMACSRNGALPQRIGCILSYGGGTLDIVINYAMLFLNLAACWVTTTSRDTTTTTRPHIASFLFVWCFQILLCLFLAEVSDDGYGCAGISIVWCAMAGWMWHRRKQERTSPQHSHLWGSLVICNVGVLSYYWITEEFITTVAHFCALILGALLSRLAKPNNFRLEEAKKST